MTGRSWRKTISIQRIDLDRHLSKNPSLRVRLPEFINDTYSTAVRKVVVKTGLDKRAFLTECPWTAEQLLGEEFCPE